MATLFANYSFDYSLLNVSDTLQATDSAFGDNAFFSYNGIVYEDLFSLEFDFGYSYLTFGGSGFRMTADAITGGTVTGILEEVWTGSGYAVAWGIERMRTSAVSVWNAANTLGTGDDVTLMQNVFAGADTFFMSNGTDRVRGYAGNDRLYGYSGRDTLYGDAGNDVLTGGLGGDRLHGGDGADIFDVNAVGESGLTSSTRDLIMDFQRGVDRIDLRTIDANMGMSGNQEFSGFIGAARSFSVAGQLKFVDGVLYGNTDTDAAAEFSIQLTGVNGLTTADLLL
jgi:hypothetical protein